LKAYEERHAKGELTDDQYQAKILEVAEKTKK
jgi:uncharacterized membrane protein